MRHDSKAHLRLGGALFDSLSAVEGCQLSVRVRDDGRGVHQR